MVGRITAKPTPSKNAVARKPASCAEGLFTTYIGIKNKQLLNKAVKNIVYSNTWETN